MLVGSRWSSHQRKVIALQIWEQWVRSAAARKSPLLADLGGGWKSGIGVLDREDRRQRHGEAAADGKNRGYDHYSVGRSVAIVGGAIVNRKRWQ
ncbi:hypothetical protein BHE74_00056402 [Ensete ventricosum]|nr:hypothetical protein GW17_00029373 [Ensete ventricosum]RWW38368.1 hypothetical protein BHE74_00056402 [Ensete ventricosum]